jgi:hypothetical protein
MPARVTLRAFRPLFVLLAAGALLGCGGSNTTPSDDAGATAGLTTTIEGACRLAETGSDIVLSYRVERTGDAPISRVRLFVDGALTEETGQTTQRVYARNATIHVPDRTSHVFQVTAEAGGARSSASTTVHCAGPTPGRGL